MDLKEGAPSNYCQGLHQHPTREKQDLNTNINPCASGIIQPAIPDPMGPQQPQWGRIALVVHSPQSTGNRKEPRNPYKQRQPEDHRRAQTRIREKKPNRFMKKQNWHSGQRSHFLNISVQLSSPTTALLHLPESPWSSTSTQQPLFTDTSDLYSAVGHSRPTLSPTVSAFLMILCLSFLLFFLSLSHTPSSYYFPKPRYWPGLQYLCTYPYLFLKV